MEQFVKMMQSTLLQCQIDLQNGRKQSEILTLLRTCLLDWQERCDTMEVEEHIDLHRCFYCKDLYTEELYCNDAGYPICKPCRSIYCYICEMREGEREVMGYDSGLFVCALCDEGLD